MIVPSIDLMNGSAVQLRGGRDLIIDAGDPRPIAETFAAVGEIAVIDLDAALKQGSNTETMRELLSVARCRVGGGIRTVEQAIAWLDAGAEGVILGTAATPDLLRELPRDRVFAALDIVDDEVVTDGWRTRTGRSIEDSIGDLVPFVGGFLVTFVRSGDRDVEGSMTGLPIERATRLREFVGDASLTVAGGVAEPEEIAALDRLGIDVQVGMALYSGRFDCADALAAMLVNDRADGRWPTVIVDESQRALGLAWSSRESLKLALAERRGVYDSRRRGIWRKGESSGHVQRLLRVDLDCDRDALRFTVRQSGPFCHRGSRTCWGDGITLDSILETIKRGGRPGSYSTRLLRDPELLAAKLREEADELIDASTTSEVTHEAADLIYFTLVRLAASDARLEAVLAELGARSKRVTRRRGDAKSTDSPPPPALQRPDGERT